MVPRPLLRIKEHDDFGRSAQGPLQTTFLLELTERALLDPLPDLHLPTEAVELAFAKATLLPSEQHMPSNLIDSDREHTGVICLTLFHFE